MPNPATPQILVESIWRLRRDPDVCIVVLEVGPGDRVVFRDQVTNRIDILSSEKFHRTFRTAEQAAADRDPELEELAQRFWTAASPEAGLEVAAEILRRQGLVQAEPQNWTWDINLGADRTATESIRVPVGMTIRFGGRQVAVLARSDSGPEIRRLIVIFSKALTEDNELTASPSLPRIAAPRSPRSRLSTPPPAHLSDSQLAVQEAYARAIDEDALDGDTDTCEACGSPIHYDDNSGWLHDEPKLDGHQAVVS